MTGRLHRLVLAVGAALLAACSAAPPGSTPVPAPATAAGQMQCPPFALPAYDQLQANPTLPDPFRFQNGAAVASAYDWACRRTELAALVQGFELGDKPARKSETVVGRFDTDTLQVTVSRRGKSVSFPLKITYPDNDAADNDAANGTAPYPAMIGVGAVSLDQADLLRQGVAIISFPNNLVAQQSGPAARGKGLFYDLYGSDHSASASMAWSWGISRAIDALHGTAAARIDPARLGVTGCSRNGKGALVAGAFDERIALTVAQESGNGGASGWRVADAQRRAGQNVQTLRQIVQENVWFSAGFARFAETAERLPFDQHSVMSLIAPRALLVLENTSLEWLGNQSAYVTSMAARDTWTALGQPDAMGFSQRGGHAHCQLPPAQAAHVQRFVRKFLLGDTTVDTHLLESDGTFSKDVSVWAGWTTPILK